jgi:hypothetical protein
MLNLELKEMRILLNYLDVFTVYPEDFDRRINAGNFHDVRDKKFIEMFSGDVSSEYQVSPVLVSFSGKGFIDTKFLIEHMRKIEGRNFRPATIEEILAFRRFNQEKPKKYSIHLIDENPPIECRYKVPSIIRTGEDQYELVCLDYPVGQSHGREVLFVEVVV